MRKHASKNLITVAVAFLVMGAVALAGATTPTYAASIFGIFDLGKTENSEPVKTEKKVTKEEKRDISERLPYIHMSEDDIEDTILGTPYEVETDLERIDQFRKVEVTYYTFKLESGETFTCKCKYGNVTEIETTLTMQEVDKINKTGKLGRYGNSYPSSDEDIYSVHKYDDPEEFYYDHADEFDGYEDAEEYFYEEWIR